MFSFSFRVLVSRRRLLPLFRSKHILLHDPVLLVLPQQVQPAKHVGVDNSTVLRSGAKDVGDIRLVQVAPWPVATLRFTQVKFRELIRLVCYCIMLPYNFKECAFVQS